jgi:hypothetical protein
VISLHPFAIFENKKNFYTLVLVCLKVSSSPLIGLGIAIKTIPAIPMFSDELFNKCSI